MAHLKSFITRYSQGLYWFSSADLAVFLLYPLG